MSIPLGGLDAKRYDVITDYKWSINGGLPENRTANVPSITLTEYEQDASNLYAQLSYWYRVVSNRNVGEDAYKGLYSAVPTGTSFVLPYYEDFHHSITQRWAKNKGVLSFSKADQVLKAYSFVKQAMGAVGTYVNQPQVWEGINEQSYSISFHLFNTDETNVDNYKNASGNSDFVRNKQLIDRLIMSSLHDQQTPIIASPPAIFTADIDGVRYSPAAVITGLTIGNVGQMNKKILGGVSVNVPDAYQVILNITELISESRQIFNSTYKNSSSRVVAIESAENTAKAAKQDGADLATAVTSRFGSDPTATDTTGGTTPP